MTMSEFGTLLAEIHALADKVERLALSQGACQAICSAERGRRRGWATWLGGAATAALAALLGFYLRR